MSVRESKDFISDMACNDDSTTLLATSGDGTLSAFDLRQKKLEQRSDQSESELLSLAIVKVRPSTLSSLPGSQ
ncbi:WD repeat-containing protein 55 [Geodia barretti]|uniref:WD repeat-containing protein 55 n=1 Tax=Geodia barretti TaxID=519541 RepID=A0AA35RPQ0_GEOBA|nr:WD repeat-containing protein 55 [Geodia barretti]